MDDRRKRILYRANHRGMTETDRLLGGFADAHLDAMTGPELDEFELLLDQGDNELLSWILADAPDNPDFAGNLVLKRIIAFKNNL
ncbi:MAG: succinate dehydrogenase assembly factor 2 [Rhodospirillales bacterium]|jgi:antitoxin CptB|nr:succinate dehydrogenase assembly factor 2 [Rhodospirillaceae bacterium]MDP6427545.1 succinate dehydrogenase assembly factor 2 [Rhodospirillales bacterium]MDP6643184.1 succinate dehydrogenase assembly factor 2 [Rhodospirillales bacterium]MDP6841516.1 succinate dehydrogenase assembly factor 2 [Rhodospirillales bacterium]|tara:strand:+ start:370 stop:624 length:255 start_codon:yes stop_codon:yes gene_type:complete